MSNMYISHVMQYCWDFPCAMLPNYVVVVVAVVLGHGRATGEHIFILTSFPLSSTVWSAKHRQVLALQDFKDFTRVASWQALHLKSSKCPKGSQMYF